ncbi:LEA type 2 family protein [Balneolaceae bacterium YR4-1]|uniref:LEA type 2 family protein n=1 Tax=Halalkalibaculum roseum TaxID=2709311 RepID=A0A6M1STB5_9BACT|nr:LEA type 2 family protein [Halalkalibaculum roseum]NGP76042.1 LEA type 2 family protein [Halalkalibaculum roseum]
MTFSNNRTFAAFGILLLVMITLFSGCSALQDLANSVQKPRLSVTDMRVSGFNFNEIELTYDITIENPNALSLQLDSYNYDFKLNDRTFIQGQQQENSTIEASGKSTLKVPVTLNFQELYQGIQTLAGADQADYEFLSDLTFDLPVLGLTKIPVSRKGSIPMLNSPSISVNSLKVQNLSLSRADLLLNMEFNNPNAFGIVINGFDYGLDINGDRWAEGESLANTSIGSKESRQLSIPISLNITEIGISAYRLLTGTGELNYSLDGNFNLGTTHPLLDQTNLKVDRSGSLPLTGN